jgi:hypothetical protein
VELTRSGGHLDAGYDLSTNRGNFNLRGVEVLLVDADGGVHRIAGMPGKPAAGKDKDAGLNGATRQRQHGSRRETPWIPLTVGSSRLDRVHVVTRGRRAA